MQIDHGGHRPRSIDEARLLMPRQAAKILRISTPELWRLSRQPSGLEVIAGGRRELFTAESVRRFKLRATA